MSKIVQLEIPFDFEEFKDIENYEGLYKISNFGRVYSVKSGKFLKPQKHKDNYLLVNLYKNEKMKTYKIHRLVAQAFIPNPLNLPQINHKDENKANNNVSNLEWCNSKYNINYGTRTEKVTEKLSKPVLQFTKDGELVAEYPSTQEAARQTGIVQNNISSCCLGSRKSAGNYVWKFKDVS